MSETNTVGLLLTLINQWREDVNDPTSPTQIAHGGQVRLKDADELASVAATLPQPPEALQDLQAFGESEKTAALKAQDRPKYDFYAGWVSALDKLAIQVTFGALPPAPPQEPELERLKRDFQTLSAAYAELLSKSVLAASPPAQEQDDLKQQLNEALELLQSPDKWMKWCDARVLERCEQLEAQLATAPPAQGWQPMETAPKDGTLILLFGASGHDIGRWQDEVPDGKESGVVVDPGSDAGWWGLSDYWPGDQQPTHWLPLPAPPLAAQEQP